MNYLNHTHDEQYIIERRILGVLLLDSYATSRIRDFLSWKNFSNRNHQLIWGAITSLFPNKPIDITTVGIVILRKTNIDLRKELAELIIPVNSSSHLEQWCLQLVELDAHIKVSRHINHYIKNGNPSKDPAWEDVSIFYKHLNTSGVDTLDLIKKVRFYFQSNCPNHRISGLIRQYDEAFFERAAKIQTRQSIRNLIGNLESTAENQSPERSAIIKALTSMLLQVLICHEIPEFIKQIHQLKTSKQ